MIMASARENEPRLGSLVLCSLENRNGEQ